MRNCSLRRTNGNFVMLACVVAALILGTSFLNPASAQEFLANRHMEKGLKCASCHKETPPKVAVPTEVCMQCHGDAAKLVELTKDVMPNPHGSHEALLCEKCHHAHKASENSCAQCHDFQFNVP